MTTTEISYTTAPQLTETLKRYRNIFAFIGLVFLSLTGAGYVMESAQAFMRAYLVGFWMWFGAGAGSLALLMLQYLTGGAWGVMIRRPLEAGAKTLFVMVLFFLPLLAGAKDLYWWTTPAGQADAVIQAKSLYLNLPFLYIRWAVYAAFFATYVFLLRKWSLEEDATKSMAVSARLEKISAPGLLVFFVLMTFCSVDYMMTLEPHWYSTVYGFMLIIGAGLTALSVMIITLTILARYEPYKHALTHKHLHDVGKLLLAFTMLWAYLNFSQLLITWSGNLPEEIIWYMKRWNGGWGWMSILLLVGHFVLPFLLLLSQPLKKNPKTIMMIATYLIVIHIVDVFNLVEPNFQKWDNVHFSMSWMDVTSPIGFGGLWLALFFGNLNDRSLLPLGAPDLQKALNHGREH